MKIRQPYSVFLLIMFLLFFLTLNVSGKPEKRSPMGFTENKGQIGDQYDKVRSDILYSSQIDGMNIFFKKDGVSYQLSSGEEQEHHHFTLREEKRIVSFEKELSQSTTRIYRLDLQWLNTNRNSILEKDNSLQGAENFYTAVCPQGVLEVKSYEGILYKQLYEGIDLHYYIKEGKLKYDYLGAAGSDYRQIQWKVEGAERIEINKKGELILHTPLGKIIEEAPVVLQGGKRLHARWCVTRNVISFSIDRLNQSQSYIIDPLVRNWGTYYGSDRVEVAVGGCIADQNGNVFLAGLTTSGANIATSGAHQTMLGGGEDAYLVKFDIDGARQWCTYFGGNKHEGLSFIKADASGNIYMTGNTRSSGLGTPGTHLDMYHGGGASLTEDKAYLVKFDNNGTRLWCTYYGIEGECGGGYCFPDGNGNIYMIGQTDSLNGIATSGAWQTGFTGLSGSYFLAKFTSTGTLLWSTFLGENISAFCGSHDLSGNVYISGVIYDVQNGINNNGGWLNTSAGGMWESFLLKLNDNGSFQWARYFGGPEDDYTTDCFTDLTGNIYILGSTSSTTGIATSGSWQSSLSGNSDGFLTKFNSSGNIMWSTYYGGEEDDGLYRGALGINGYLYVGGGTNSTMGISTPGAWQVNLGGGNFGNAMIAQFDEQGIMHHATYYGGTGGGDCEGIASDLFGNVYLAGCTSNNNSLEIASDDGWDTTYDNRTDSYLVQFSFYEPLPIIWTNIESSCENGNREILWSTASEVNNDAFIIQYSKDGKEFYDKAIVKSKGNSTVSQTYSFIDTEIKEAVYFRIAQRDIDQSTSHSTIHKLADCRDKSDFDPLVFPNPSDGKFSILLKQPAEIFVYDELGRQVYEHKTSESDTAFSLNLASGVYFMKVIFQTGQVKTMKLVSW